jgi:hypothetical protein
MYQRKAYLLSVTFSFPLLSVYRVVIVLALVVSLYSSIAPPLFCDRKYSSPISFGGCRISDKVNPLAILG